MPTLCFLEEPLAHTSLTCSFSVAKGVAQMQLPCEEAVARQC